MVKNYNLSNDEIRKELIVKIHGQKMSICKAASELGIKYPTAKAINAVYLKENRIKKKQHYDLRKKQTDPAPIYNRPHEFAPGIRMPLAFENAHFSKPFGQEFSAFQSRNISLASQATDVSTQYLPTRMTSDVPA